MPGGVRPVSSGACTRRTGAFFLSLGITASSALADVPAQLRGYAQTGILRTTVAATLTERDADELMRSLRASLELWKDRGVPTPLQNSRLAFAPAGDLGGLLARLSDRTKPYLESGRTDRVERLLSAVNISRCLRGFLITRDYVGPLEVRLALRESADHEWEIQANLTAPLDQGDRGDRVSFKGMSLVFPTGVSAFSRGRTPE